MFRILALATSAALLAAPAYADSIRISTADKTPEQVTTEIKDAAYKLCRAESRYTVFETQLRTNCMRRAVREALNQYSGIEMVESASR
jgi:phosphate-selective porin